MAVARDGPPTAADHWTAEALYHSFRESYDRNALAGTDRFCGRSYVVSGEVCCVGESPSLGVDDCPLYITLATTHEDRYVWCRFSNAHRGELSSLGAGDSVSVSGSDLQFTAGDLWLDDCDLISREHTAATASSSVAQRRAAGVRAPVSDEMLPLWNNLYHASAAHVALWDMVEEERNYADASITCARLSGTVSAWADEARAVYGRNGRREGDRLITEAARELAVAYATAGRCIGSMDLPARYRNQAEIQATYDQYRSLIASACDKQQRAQTMYENAGGRAPWQQE